MIDRQRLLRLLTVIGVSGLGVLALAYWLTYEPAPSIRLEWDDSVSPALQADLERKYLLSNGRVPKDRSVAYDLLDTRPSNVEALINDPNIRSTNDLDRRNYVVPFDAAYGESWMWVAHRVPGLRDSRVRWSLIGLLAALAVVPRLFARLLGST